MNAMLCLALVIGAPGLKEKPGAKPGLEGDWQAVTLNNNGEVTPGDSPPVRFVFESGGVWRLFRDEMEITAPPRTYEFDAKANPPTIDMKADTVFRGIYKLEEDTLTLCLQRDPKERPTAFEAPPGSGANLYVFKRVKK